MFLERGYPLARFLTRLKWNRIITSLTLFSKLTTFRRTMEVLYLAPLLTTLIGNTWKPWRKHGEQQVRITLFPVTHFSPLLAPPGTLFPSCYNSQIDKDPGVVIKPWNDVLISQYSIFYWGSWFEWFYIYFFHSRRIFTYGYYFQYGGMYVCVCGVMGLMVVITSVCWNEICSSVLINDSVLVKAVVFCIFFSCFSHKALPLLFSLHLAVSPSPFPLQSLTGLWWFDIEKLFTIDKVLSYIEYPVNLWVKGGTGEGLKRSGLGPRYYQNPYNALVDNISVWSENCKMQCISHYFPEHDSMKFAARNTQKLT